MSSKTSENISTFWFIFPWAIVLVGILIATCVLIYPTSDDVYSNVPDGWYHQREHVQVTGEYSMIRENYILFAMCDHDYLGPLHGSFKLACNITQNGWYNFYVRNNEIVAAEIYEVDNR